MILRIAFRWPDQQPPIVQDNCFVGFWHPDRSIEVRVSGCPPERFPVTTGSNWLFLSAASPLHEPVRPLAHPSGFAFRGYVLDPPLHSYSDPAELAKYWTDPLGRVHNGVFSAALVADGGDELLLLTDALGLGPIYWREFAGGILFATSGRYLAAAGDEPDWMAWRQLIETGFISSDRSLTEGVRRVPAGCALRFRQCARPERIAWFPFSELPEGKRPVEGRDSLLAVEEALETSLAKCLTLAPGYRTLLPLSSGHDSRRLLALLLKHQTPFQALTAHTVQKEQRDLDAPFAAAMAREFSFPHAVVELGGVEQHVADHACRRLLVDGETQMHSWAVRFMACLPQRPVLLLDGLLGDILGNPGFRLAGLYESPERDLDIILTDILGGVFDPFLDGGRLPRAGHARGDIRAYLETFGRRPNLAEFAFVLLRQRRATALWSQQLLPPGHLPVCPYAELGYLRTILDFLPADKHRTVFQRACLEAFWPDLAKFGGNRDIPAGMPPGPSGPKDDRTVACLDRMVQEIAAAGRLDLLNACWSWRGRGWFELARRVRPAAVARSWHIEPVLELVAREAGRKVCWEVS